MASTLPYSFSQGYVSARSASDMFDGELQAASGIYYKKGDPHPWKQLGRTAFGTVLASNRIKGLALCLFDDGTDYLVASAGTAYYGATPGATGTFSSLLSGLSSSATEMSAVHMNDRWYLANGYNKVKKLKSSGTIVDAGMATPTQTLTVVKASTVGSIAYPTASTGSFANAASAYDTDDATYSNASLAAAGTTTGTWTTWGADATAGRSLEVRWWMAGLPMSGDSGDIDTLGTGGTISAGYTATVLLEKSEDGGTVWSTIYTQTMSEVPRGIQTNSIDVTANSSLIQFRASITYVSGTNSATLRILSLKIRVGSTTTAFSTTTGFYYAYTEYDSAEDIESPPSELTGLITLSSQNQVTLTRPTAINSTATDWKIYRVYDGGTATITNLGFIATVPIAQTTYIDTFAVPYTYASAPIVPLISLGDLPFPRDTQPPSFVYMFTYDASVCGISLDFPRELRYSDAGRPESFPEFYIVSAFSLPEHDRLVCGVDLGRTCVLFAEGAVLAVNGLPRVVDGQFEAGKALPIAGHPGCVGRKAMTKFSVSGEGRAAWVSPFGIYQTNGETCEPISLDIDWETEVSVPYLSTASLEWDQKNMILWFDFDSDGDGSNDRTVPIHMSPTHAKQSGQPKWGQPTAKDRSCTAGGLVSATYRRYSGHSSDGVVYLEESGYTDAATGDAISCSVKTGEIDTGSKGVGVQKVNLEHSDWGTGEEGTLTVVTGRDIADSTQTVSKTISLAGDKTSQVMVARAGDWITIQFQHSDSAAGRIGKGVIEADTMGRKGKAPRWASTPATP